MREAVARPAVSQVPFAASLFTADEWKQLRDSLSLTRRELQVVNGIFAGLNETMIARLLGISPHTVHSYLDRVYRKLRVNTRVDLVLRVVAEHLGETHRGAGD